ncbi:hypothetical protein HELRODRAFT_85627, partial [Helobdella robusta]|uniref:Uncharacterized protein n=1 Tax=Helobdella robusta TaxID=6412 RepID=T1G609_HELRO
LLDLGSSANYRDEKGITPLYMAVFHVASARCVEMLLFDHSIVGIVDEYGWTELHHVRMNE